MCGIAGITGSHRVDAIKKMTDVLAHRGPDDSGFFYDDFSEFARYMRL